MSTDARDPNGFDLKALFAKRDDPYAGADLVLSRRSLGLMSLLTALLTTLFLPLAPPTHSVLGWIGWLIAAIVIVGGYRGGRALLSSDCETGFNQMLMWTYLGLARIVLLDWLAGGNDTPYQSLALISMIGAVGVHHSRRAAVFMLTLVPALGAPLVYNGWDHELAVHIATKLLLDWSIGAVLVFYLARVRAQRVKMRDEENAAKRLARADVLTELGNRRAFDEALEAEVARTRRAGSALSIALVDLDGLKRINDAHGHLEGDRALRQVARALKLVVRTADRCFRWAGDEFAVILPDTTAEEAAVVRARLVEQVRSSCHTSFGEPLMISIGVAELGEGDMVSLMATADEDLLAQKAARKDSRFVIGGASDGRSD
jgi:diguanylate cyclase (GGDEF)-like protein